MYKENNLSKNQQIIFDLINKSSEPLKAYTILFSVQKKGIKAPPQVYRALDKLVKTGKIHKIERFSAFDVCLHGLSGAMGRKSGKKYTKNNVSYRESNFVLCA